MIPDNGLLSLFWNSRSAGTKGLAQSRSITSGSIMTKSRWLLYDKSTSDNSVYASVQKVDKHVTNEPRREKTGFSHMRKQRRRSASR